jgi:hypothetical protein
MSPAIREPLDDLAAVKRPYGGWFRRSRREPWQRLVTNAASVDEAMERLLALAPRHERLGELFAGTEPPC